MSSLQDPRLRGDDNIRLRGDDNIRLRGDDNIRLRGDDSIGGNDNIICDEGL